MQKSLSSFEAISCLDFEFDSKPGERPVPICLVVEDYLTGEISRFWQDDLCQMKYPPYRTDKNALVVAYFASAELNCHLALDWELPVLTLDLYPEFRCLTNGLKLDAGNSLLGALSYFGISTLSAAEKESMRALALRGGPWSKEEREALLDYCQSDVRAVAQLLRAMAPSLSLEYALLRGRYIRAVAEMESNGIPIDTESFELLRRYWGLIQEELIAAIDSEYCVFEGRTFKEAKFGDFLLRKGLAWPRLPSGKLALDEDTFKSMTKSYPELGPLHQLRSSLGKMRLAEMPIGKDGRNRTLISPFKSRTGRNQPSNSKFIFGAAAWMRGVIQPPKGRALAYIDWSQQEFGIAAALSGDSKMGEAYHSGDPYLTFAKQAKAAPPDATKKSHEAVRDQFKECVLAVQYGMGEESLAQRICRPKCVARELLGLHKKIYQRFWAWSDSVVDSAILLGNLTTTYGWSINLQGETNPRFLRNFLMQANGAEMMRLACCLVVERGVELCAPIHDALLVEANEKEIEKIVQITQLAMEEASAIILGGFGLRSDAKIIRYPDRYEDKRGAVMWQTVWELIQKLEER